MQLAAPQRAHPPPVPPRPSRQVVAEALKKSPRPPCPTRQAPPPPNQRPWRLEEQQRQRPRESSGGGRTIVYDSAHLVKPRKPVEERRRPAPRDLSKVSQLVARKSNGITEVREEPAIEDTTRRKEEDVLRKPRGNEETPEASIRSDKQDEREGVRLEVKESAGSNGSAERKRRKAHNVTFDDEGELADGTGAEAKGDDAVEETLDRSVAGEGDDRDERGANIACRDRGEVVDDARGKSVPEVCATVVVIEEAEGSRPAGGQEEHDNIRRQDWLEAGVRYSSTKITLPAEEVVLVNGCARQELSQQRRRIAERGPAEKEEDAELLLEGGMENQLEFGDLNFSSILERIAMSSLQGLPPLPRSLSGFNLNGAGLVGEPPPPPPARSTSRSQRAPKTTSSTTSLSSQGSRPSPQGRQLTTLDTQLAILRREMFGLRQLDLSLLSQLWSLNESIQEFRQLLQEQEDRVPSPSPSSEEGDDTSYSGSAQPPPPPRRSAPTTPHHQHHQQQQQQQHHHHHHHHLHHRSARSMRNSQLSPSDESPSSEEYGAV